MGACRTKDPYGGVPREPGVKVLSCLALAALAVTACGVDDRHLVASALIQDGGAGGPYLLPLDGSSAGGAPGSGGGSGAGGRVVIRKDGGAAGTPGTEGGSDPNGCYHTDPSGNPDCASTLMENADFNVNVAGWTGFDNVAVAWSPDDSQGSKHSGSISITNTTPYTKLDGYHPSGVWQCIPATPGQSYDFSVNVLIPDGQPLGSSGQLAVWLYGDDTCADLVQAYGDLTSDASQWQIGIGTGLTMLPPGSPGAPKGERSMKIFLEAVKPFKAGGVNTPAPLEVRFDAVRVVERAAPAGDQ